jgi:hypothetical protein
MSPDIGARQYTKLADVDNGSGRLFVVSTDGSGVILHELSLASAITTHVATFAGYTVTGPASMYSATGLFFMILDQDLVGVSVFNGSTVFKFSDVLFSMTISMTLDDRTFGSTTELWGLALPSVGVEVVYKFTTRTSVFTTIGQAGCASSLYSLVFDPANNVLFSSTANALKLITVSGTVTCTEYTGFQGIVWLKSKCIQYASHGCSAVKV